MPACSAWHPRPMSRRPCSIVLCALCAMMLSACGDSSETVPSRTAADPVPPASTASAEARGRAFADRRCDVRSLTRQRTRELVSIEGQAATYFDVVCDDGRRERVYYVPATGVVTFGD